VKVVDLRRRSSRCTDHPVVRFMNMLAELRNSGERKVLFVVNKEDLPLGVVSKFVEGAGYRIVSTNDKGEYLEVILERR